MTGEPDDPASIGRWAPIFGILEGFMEDGIVTRWLTRDDVFQKVVSYAQNGEDILLARAFGVDHAGFYVDVGANDPVFHSVTKLLYGRGWRGINIEPTPSLHGRLVADRPEDVNLNVGIAEAEGTLTFHAVAPPLHGWSTFDPAVARAYRDLGVESVPRPVPVTTLDRVFERYAGDRTVDVLKVDAEGFERQVIASIDLERWRPRVIVAEATWSELWEPRVLGARYAPAAFDGINRYYVRAEDPGLLAGFAAPANNADNFIAHEVVRLVEDLERQLAGARSLLTGRLRHVELLGPTVLGIARRLRDAAHRNPGAARVAKRLLRLVGWHAGPGSTDEPARDDPGRRSPRPSVPHEASRPPGFGPVRRALARPHPGRARGRRAGAVPQLPARPRGARRLRA